MTKLPGYYTTAELAEATGLGQNTIRYHCATGQLKGLAVWTQTEWLIADAHALKFIADHPKREGK